MKLIIEYDPWMEAVEARRAADAMKTLGIPVQLREILLSLNESRARNGLGPVEEMQCPITFDFPAN